MSGRKRTTIPGGHYPIGAVKVPDLLERDTGIDFSKHLAAKKEIDQEFRRFQSRKFEQKDSPGHKELAALLTKLEKDCRCARHRFSDPWGQLPKSEILQIEGAVSELLINANLPSSSWRSALDAVDGVFVNLDNHIVALQATLAMFEAEGGLAVTNEAWLREQFIRNVRAILVRHGLDASTGSKSPLTLIIIQLEGNRKHEAAADLQHRKSVSESIRRLVNPQKGG